MLHSLKVAGIISQFVKILHEKLILRPFGVALVKSGGEK